MGSIESTGGGTGQDGKFSGSPTSPRLIAQDVGGVTVYFRVTGENLELSSADQIYEVASDKNVFEQATDAVKALVSKLAGKMKDVAETVGPTELEVELSFEFVATGKAVVIPVFVTGESTATAGLKVTAKWTNSPTKKFEN